jgi:hypothetical protein
MVNTQEVYENRHQLYTITCIVVLVFVFAILVIELLRLYNNPIIIVEYRNQSCPQKGINGLFEPISNITPNMSIIDKINNMSPELPTYPNWSLSNTDLGFGFGASELPKDYVKVESYRQVCDFTGCRFYKETLYLNKSLLVSQ